MRLSTSAVLAAVCLLLIATNSHARGARSDEAELEIRTIKSILREMSAGGDKEVRAARAGEAREHLLPLLLDPHREELELWVIAGALAVELADADVGAFAFEAIKRLKPGFAQDDKLSELMAQLNRLPIKERVKAIPGERAVYAAWKVDGPQ